MNIQYEDGSEKLVDHLATEVHYLFTTQHPDSVDFAIKTVQALINKIKEQALDYSNLQLDLVEFQNKIEGLKKENISLKESLSTYEAENYDRQIGGF